jgi:outer membrane protein assembly factor BamD (BamD/ComL family)
MKKTICVAIGILVIVTFALALIHKSHWQWASRKNETASYKVYETIWPVGRHKTEGMVQYDEHGWSDAQTANTVLSYERYIQLHPDGKHVAEAKNNIDSLHWQETFPANTFEDFLDYKAAHQKGEHSRKATDNTDSLHWQGTNIANTVLSYERYIQLHPDGKHVAEAKDNIDSFRWQEAITANTVPSYERYTQLHPDGKHVVEAKDNIDSLRWKEAIAANAGLSYERYIKLHPDGKHVAKAKDNIDTLHWQESLTANTIKAFRNYKTAHQRGQHLREAEIKEASLRVDYEPFRAALKVGTMASLKQFLDNFPGHTKETEAQQAFEAVKRSASTLAQVQFFKGGSITLEEFTLDNGPIIKGTSTLCSGLEVKSSIDIKTADIGGYNSVTLSIILDKSDEPFTLKREGWHHIRGTVQAGDDRYTFHTRLSMCKRIELTPSPKTISYDARKKSVSCIVTSTNGTTLSLDHVQAFSTRRVFTGCQFMSISYGPGADIYESIYVPATNLTLFVSDGLINFNLSQIKELDFDDGLLALRNGHIVNVLKPDIRLFNGSISVGGVNEAEASPFDALAGQCGNKYVAIEREDIRHLVVVKSVDKKESYFPQIPSSEVSPLPYLSVIDVNGQTQNLESATIVSPYMPRSMGRILMNRMQPNWCISRGAFDNVKPRDEFSSQIAVKHCGFWMTIAIPDIAKWTKGSNGNGCLILRGGRKLLGAQLEFGEIKGKGAWRVESYSPQNVEGIIFGEE